MNDSEGDAGRNRRETPAAVIQGRAARQLVAPVQEKLGTWHAEAVKLEVMTQRMKASGRSDPGLAEAVRTLIGVVGMQAQLFETAVADATAPVREHTRVTDAQKALNLLLARLESILGELGEPGDKAR